ncbi:MAG TPA: hypothetical protein VFZ19_04290 [Solirubrobacterales bacterium]
MTHKLKTLLAFGCAALALSGLMATAAQANFTASSYPASITGVSGAGNGILGTEAGGSECSEHWQGSMFEADTRLTMEWTITKCQWFGSQTWQVNTNGCDVRFNLTGGSGDSYTASTDIVCPAGKAIEITVGNCAFNYPPQTGLGSVDFTNNTASGDISMQATITGMKYVVTKDGFLCTFSGIGEKSGGTYTHASPVTLDASLGSLDIG